MTAPLNLLCAGAAQGLVKALQAQLTAQTGATLASRAVTSRLRAFPNGATAMRALAASAEAGAIGCTQITEILDTSGIALLGALPLQFELATVCTAAVSATASQPALARQFIGMLAGNGSQAVRRAGGFEF